MGETTEATEQVNVNVVEAKNQVRRAGAYLDVGGLWVRADLIATIKEIPDHQGPYCQVVLDVPGYKTLGVGCTADTLLDAIIEARRHGEFVTGIERAKGMRWNA